MWDCLGSKLGVMTHETDSERSGRGRNRRRDSNGNVEPGECVARRLGARSVLGRSGGRGRNRRRRRDRNRITALLPLWLLWLLWLLRTTASAAVSTRVERLCLGARLLLRVWPARNWRGYEP